MHKFTAIHERRLMNVALALLTAPEEKAFAMNKYGWQENNEFNHPCGTPACALGHYAARRDLQTTFMLGKSRHGVIVPKLATKGRGNKPEACYQDPKVLKHFGLEAEEAELLFDSDGCGEAKTPVEAAQFIARFVRRKKLEVARQKAAA